MFPISFGKLDIKLVSILIGCVFCFLNRLLNQFKGTLLFENIFLTNVYIHLSGIFTAIPLIIFKFRNKQVNFNDTQIPSRVKSKNSKKKTVTHSSLEYIYKINKTSHGKWKYIIILTIIFFADSIFFVYTFEAKTNVWIWFIVFSSIIYYYIFKVKLYKHHYLSVALIILIGITIDLIVENFQNDFSNSKRILLFFIHFIRVILLSLYYVISKYAIEKKNCSIYELNFFICSIIFILYIIISIFDYCFIGLYDYKKYFSNFNTTELLVALGVVFTQLGKDLSAFMTDKDFSPCHIFIIFVFGQLAYYIDFSKKHSVIVIISLIFMLFFSLIFNEIIEINICGLSYNTRRNIINRAQIETEEYMITLNSIEDESSKDDYSIESNNTLTY